MTLLTKEMKVRWNGSTRKHYEERGYVWTKANEWFTVPIEDAITTTPNKVEVECDYCGRFHTKEYRAYIKSREIVEKDCCSNRKCMYAKSEDVNMIKYGVKNINSLDIYKEKQREKLKSSNAEVLQFSENKGLIVLNIDSYQNDRTRLNVKCIKHPEAGIIETNFANIKSQSHCCKLGGLEVTAKAKKKSPSEIRELFIDSGLIPMFKDEECLDSTTSLAYQCPHHLDKGIQYRKYTTLYTSKGCYYCAKERTGLKLMLNQNDVFDYFEARGLLVEDGEQYLGKEHPIACRCVRHTEFVQYKTYHNLNKIQEPCEYCRNEKSLTELGKILRSSISSWRKKSEKSCDYKCVLTGSEKYDVHHLYSFKSIIKDSLEDLKVDINNYSAKDIIEIKRLVINKHNELMGVCIHPTLHILFHQLHSKENNTQSQFEEFKSRYLNGEFDEMLREKEVV